VRFEVGGKEEKQGNFATGTQANGRYTRDDARAILERRFDTRKIQTHFDLFFLLAFHAFSPVFCASPIFPSYVFRLRWFPDSPVLVEARKSPKTVCW
jgi:hypothetical protein